MRVILPQQTLTCPLNIVRPMTVIRYNREHYIVTGSRDPSADLSDEEHRGEDDILCLNIQTTKVEPICGVTDVELMEADLTVRDVVRMPTPYTESHLPLTPAELTEIRAGRKIQAIKLVRERTRLGLKEAKDLVDAEASRMGL